MSISVAYTYPESILDDLQTGTLNRSSSLSSQSPKANNVNNVNSQSPSRSPPSLSRSNTGNNNNANNRDIIHGSVWQTGSADIIRQFFTYLCSAPSLYIACNVCKSWLTAINHPSTFASLSLAYNWPNKGKKAFIDKYITTKIFKSSIPMQSFIEDKRAGILNLYIPPVSKHYNWSTGSYETVNNNILVTASSAPLHSINVYSTASNKLIREQSINNIHIAGGGGQQFNHKMQWSAVDIKGSLILFADSQTPQLYIYNVDYGTLRKFQSHTHNNAITCVKHCNHSNLALSGSYDHTVRVWNISTGAQLAVLKGDNNETVWCVDMHPTANIIAMGSDDDSIRIFKLDPNQPTTSPINNNNNNNADERKDDNKNNNDIGGSLLRVLKGHTRCPMVVKFDPLDPDNYVYSSGYDATIRKWNYNTGVCVKQYASTNTIFAMEILEHVIISTIRGNLVHIYDRETGEIIRILTVGAVATPATNNIYGLGMHATTGHASIDVKCVSISIDGMRIAVGNTAGCICVWQFGSMAATSIEDKKFEKLFGQKIKNSKEECSIM